jgi:hypothetical protein
MVFVTLSLIMYTFDGWLAVVPFVFVCFLAFIWIKKALHNTFIRHENRWIYRQIDDLVVQVKHHSFDESTIIRTLEKLECSPFTGIEGVVIHIPDVLYALLRLPRRDVQSELLNNYRSLDADKRLELHRRWREFVDALLNYDE